MNLYYLEFANKDGEVYSTKDVVAESPAHLIPSLSLGKAHDLRGIEYICEFNDYKSGMSKLKTDLTYLFYQIKELATVAGLFVDAGISGKPGHERFDTNDALSLSFQADHIYDLIEKARKYVSIVESRIEEQKAVSPEPQEQITQ